eukprot:g349.t1
MCDDTPTGSRCNESSFTVGRNTTNSVDGDSAEGGENAFTPAEKVDASIMTYGIPALVFGGVGLLGGGFFYGIRRQQKKIEALRAASKRPTLSRKAAQMAAKDEQKKVATDGKNGGRPTLFTRRLPTASASSEVSSMPILSRQGSSHARVSNVVADSMPRLQKHSANPVATDVGRSAMKALGYGSLLACGGAFVLVGFTAWALDVRSVREFGDTMRVVAPAYGDQIRGVFAVSGESVEEGNCGPDAEKGTS